MAAQCNNLRNPSLRFPNTTLTLFLSFLFFPLQFSNAIYFNFSRFRFLESDINWEGAAVVGDPNLELTGFTNTAGRATYPNPVRLWDPATRMLTNFTTSFTFIINPIDTGSFGHGPSGFGDGLTFFLAPHEAKIPPNCTGGFLGLLNNSTMDSSPDNPIVAVEFDTFSNSWDPNYWHVGIDVNSIVSVVNTSWLNFMAQVANVRISYNAGTEILSAFISYDSHPGHNSSLSYRVDLMEVLPEWIIVGFSGATGAGLESHTILSWEFSSSLETDEGTVVVPPPGYTGKRSDNKTVILVCGLVIFVGGVLVWRLWRRVVLRRRKGGREMALDESIMDDVFKTGIGPKRFSYNDLVLATKGFSEEGKLGEGGFGAVYKGFLSDLNLGVAVKKISRESKQGKKEYVSEVKIISRLRHRNLVQLIGWCHDRGELLLVYELLPNGSLDSHLFGGKISLSWSMRYKIALGLASALFYLHEEWEQCVVHRDIKSSNVMLDSGFNAKLGDFGLARLGDHRLGLQTTALAGTLGYLAPECFINGKASKESDVFSFGVVALEIACGRKAVEHNVDESKVRLIDWVWEVYGRGNVLEAVDENLRMDFDEKEMECLMVVGLWCSYPDQSLRPTMKQTIQVLKFEAALPDLPEKLPMPVYCVPPSVQSVPAMDTFSSYRVGR